MILVENPDFNPSHLYSAPPLRVTASKYHGDLWFQKTRVPALSYSTVSMILHLDVSVQYELVAEMDRHGAIVYTEISIASCGKKFGVIPLPPGALSPFSFLWLPYRTGQAIIFLLCGFFLSIFFFPRPISAVGNWMSTILPHMVSPQSEFRMQI